MYIHRLIFPKMRKHARWLVGSVSYSIAMQGSSFAVHECRHISIITAISGAGRPRAALELLDVSLGFAWEDDRCLISPYLISSRCFAGKKCGIVCLKSA